MTVKLSGFHRKLYQTRYARKAKDKRNAIEAGSSAIVLTQGGEYPVRETAIVEAIHGNNVEVTLTSGDQSGQKFTQRIEHVDILIETEYEQTAMRVALAIASVESPGIRTAVAKQFAHVISNFDFIPSGRILAGAGDDALVTLFNCYVTDIIPAPYKKEAGADSRQAIFYHEQRIAEIMAHGGGNGSCLSTLRPRYTMLSTTKGESAGAVFTGNRFSSLTQWVNQGNRRGAQMLTLHDWHPDVFYTNNPGDGDYSEDFIGAKTKPGFMEGNNSSVLISDAFMEAVSRDGDWELVFPDTTHPLYNKLWDGDLIKWKEQGLPVNVYTTVKARAMWDKLVKCNWLSAEPGIIFIDEVNRKHNLWYLGRIKATNPCGEQPLLNNSTCNLGAVNWGRMVKVIGHDSHGAIYAIDWVKFDSTVRIAMRFLDNVIDVTHYFDTDMVRVQRGERRVGLGLLGLADLLIALRVPYGSEQSLAIVEAMIQFQRDTAYDASIGLAVEKGKFPSFERDKFIESGFVKTLPKYLQDGIRKYGIRNGTCLTIAPTGTTGSITPSLLDPQGSVSTGCEPHYAMSYTRKSRIGTTVQYAGVAQRYIDEHPGERLPRWFVGAMDLTPEQHVTMQAVLQKYIDTSISKTVNCPSTYTEQDVAKVYELAHAMGLKGCTIYRDGSRNEQILSLNDSTTVENEVPDVIEVKELKMKGKYDDWTCGVCGSKHFTMVENCPQCNDCGSQVCSIGS